MTPNALTIDVEDYHSVFARDRLRREIEPTPAVVENSTRLLEMMASRGVRGTFFILGEVTAAFPGLVRSIAAAGHELGVHGYYHRLIFTLSREQFHQEVSRTKQLVEDLTGRPVFGHRAPAFSITPDNPWAFEVLADLGFRYDSSVFPIRGRRYGWPDAPSDIHVMTLSDGRQLIEAPLSTISVFGKRFPVCGGGYLRHFPAFVTTWAFRRVQRQRPVIVYLHPYEIELSPPPPDTAHLDPEEARGVRRFHESQVRNRETVEGKIIRLLNRFQFAPLWEVIRRALPVEDSGPAGL